MPDVQAEAAELWHNTGMEPSIPHSFFPTSTSSLQGNHLAEGSSWTRPAGRYLWMIRLIVSLGSNLKLLSDWYRSLCAAQLWKQSRSYELTASW